MGPRSAEQRRSDALVKLTARHPDLWIASSSSSGRVHLVPLSFAWDGEHIIIATETASLTTRNVSGSQVARLALGATRDAVMIDVSLASVTPLSETPSEIKDRYAAQADWDPHFGGWDFVYLLLRPERIQAWREADEIEGRTVMRQGSWLV